MVMSIGGHRMFKRLGEHRRTIGHWAMELAIVVAGVLIALAAQQWAEDRSSKSQASAADSRIREELGGNLLNGVERIALHNCLKQRLATLAQGLASGRTDWSTLASLSIDTDGTAFQRLYRMPLRNWIASEFHGSSANGALDSVSAERASGLAAIYNQVEHQANLNAQESSLATSLAVLQFQRALTDAQRGHLLEELTRLDHINGLVVLVSRQMIDQYFQLYPKLTADEVTEARKSDFWRAKVADMRSIYGPCVDAKAIGLIDKRLLS